MGAGTDTRPGEQHQHDTGDGVSHEVIRSRDNRDRRRDRVDQGKPANASPSRRVKHDDRHPKRPPEVQARHRRVQVDKPRDAVRVRSAEDVPGDQRVRHSVQRQPRRRYRNEPVDGQPTRGRDRQDRSPPSIVALVPPPQPPEDDRRHQKVQRRVVVAGGLSERRVCRGEGVQRPFEVQVQPGFTAGDRPGVLNRDTGRRVPEGAQCLVRDVERGYEGHFARPGVPAS